MTSTSSLLQVLGSAQLGRVVHYDTAAGIQLNKVSSMVMRTSPGQVSSADL